MIDSYVNEELVSLRDSARAWAGDVSESREFNFDTEIHQARWQAMATLGWTGVAIDEEFGGVEFGLKGLLVILTELGRELIPSPMISTSLTAALSIQLVGTDEQKKRWLPQIANGESIFAVAIDDDAHHRPDEIKVTADKVEGGWLLNGEKSFVFDLALADYCIVVAKIVVAKIKEGDEQRDKQNKLGLFVVAKNELKNEQQWTRLNLVDASDCGKIQLSGVKVSDDSLIGEGACSEPVFNQLLDLTYVGLAAEMIGMSEKALELTIDYLKSRQQFGQFIGSFQALQHRTAKMYIELELVKACLDSLMVGELPVANELSVLASLMKTKACRALHLISNEMVQMHGGMGMTDEFIAGRYLKRARVLETRFGNAAFHLERFARLNNY